MRPKAKIWMVKSQDLRKEVKVGEGKQVVAEFDKYA